MEVRPHIDRSVRAFPQQIAVNNKSSSFKIKNVPYHLAKEEVEMKSLLRLLLKSQQQRKRSKPTQTEKGMTLIELLIGTVMAFLILTPMLAFVVDMLNTDRREQVKANTEQDIQAAVDFIAQDLSQAIYIYDNAGVTAINSQLPPATNGTPILVFWKRKQLRNSVSVNRTTIVTPLACDQTTCNDTYTRSLVAYYQVRDANPIWCQPSGNPSSCPKRIERYEISEGILKDSTATTAATRYFNDTETKDGQRHSGAFNLQFDFNQPTLNVTTGANFPRSAEVLVNYLDHSTTANVPQPPNCKSPLGVVDPTGPGATPINAADLLITDGSTHSFYACVDTRRNLAKVTIRGNSLRRIQTDANYDANRSAFFPTANVQVQGRGARGQ
jgi:type II secretory pathway pseudopilin PulG